jgi:hypothetical protein
VVRSADSGFTEHESFEQYGNGTLANLQHTDI